jgi:hypothetical protein
MLQQPRTRSCAADGFSSSLVSTCATTDFCDPATATCKAQICSPGQPVCDGNEVATCNATGSGDTGTETDCTLNRMICGAGSCTSSASDTVGQLSNAGSGTLISSAYSVDFYAVTANRTLTEIEQHVGFSAGPVAVTFLVFSSTTQTGTYTLVDSYSYTPPGGTGYISAGSVGIPLVAGKFYAIGIFWLGNLTLFNNLTAWGASLRPTVSFGTVFDGQAGSVQSAPTSITYSNLPRGDVVLDLQRLTTGP